MKFNFCQIETSVIFNLTNSPSVEQGSFLEPVRRGPGRWGPEPWRTRPRRWTPDTRSPSGRTVHCETTSRKGTEKKKLFFHSFSWWTGFKLQLTVFRVRIIIYLLKSRRGWIRVKMAFKIVAYLGNFATPNYFNLINCLLWSSIINCSNSLRSYFLKLCSGRNLKV